jgi:hypothetical protein
MLLGYLASDATTAAIHSARLLRKTIVQADEARPNRTSIIREAPKVLESIEQIATTLVSLITITPPTVQDLPDSRKIRLALSILVERPLGHYATAERACSRYTLPLYDTRVRNAELGIQAVVRWVLVAAVVLKKKNKSADES